MHKVILAAHSNFFEALFTYEEKKEFKIGDITQDVLKIILDSFYEINCFNKPINCHDDQELDMILEVIATAEYLIAPFLLKKAIRILMESLEEAIPFCSFEAIPQAEAYSHQISKILDFSRNFQIQDLENQILSNYPPLFPNGHLILTRAGTNQLQNYQKYYGE